MRMLAPLVRMPPYTDCLKLIALHPACGIQTPSPLWLAAATSTPGHSATSPAISTCTPSRCAYEQKGLCSKEKPQPLPAADGGSKGHQVARSLL